MTQAERMARLLATVRIYCDYEAEQRDEFGRLWARNELKPVHDELYALAIKLKLADALALTDAGKGFAAIRDKFSVVAKRPLWWPAHVMLKGQGDFMLLRLRPFSSAPLGKDWLVVRAAIDAAIKFAIWNNDPALVFSPFPGSYLCRTACLGHEGWVYYFVYGAREQEWEAAIVSRGLRLCGQGERAYREVVPEPGRLAGY